MGNLFNCDRSEHGYGCFHLDEDLSALSSIEQEKWNKLRVYYPYDALAEVDEAMEDVRAELSSAEDSVGELSDDLDQLVAYRRLLEKKAIATPLTEGVQLGL